MEVEVIRGIGRKWGGKENCEPGAQVCVGSLAGLFTHWSKV